MGDGGNREKGEGAIRRRMKQFTGIVVSAKSDKTRAVEVKRLWTHRVYKKKVVRTKRYLVHDKEGKALLNDLVLFGETRPISKRKRYVILPVLIPL